MTDEEFVRSKWSTLNADRGHPGTRLALGVGGVLFRATSEEGEARAWAAAAEFTRKREREIAEVEEEIAWISGFSAYAGHRLYGPCRARILARLEAALAELRRGWRGDQ